MSKLIVRGTQVLEYTGYCNNSGQHTVDIKMRADWTDKVCEAMGWAFEAQGFGTGKLEGKLFGISLAMEPNKEALKDYRYDISISQVSDFKHVANMKEGEIVGHNLEFTVTSVAEDATAVLKEYVQHCGPAGDLGQCRITYNAEEQMKIEAGTGDAAPEAEEKVRGRKKAAAE